jgi:hypothetical protein
VKHLHAPTAFAILLTATLLSLITVFNQVKTLGLSWQEEHYIARLEAVAAGEAESPWQYRVLSDIPLLYACRAADALGIPRGPGLVLVGVRILQNIVLFLVALGFWRRLGLSTYLGLLGLSGLAWAMTQANYNSDLSVNTYTNITLYLLGAWALVAGRPTWIIPLTFVGALNRETIGLLPVMTLAAGITFSPRMRIAPDHLRAGPIALGLYFVVFAGLRLWFGSRGWVLHPDGAVQGPSLFVYNLTFDRTWLHLAGTWGILPIIAIFGHTSWPPVLRTFFWSLVPAWIGIHFVLSAVAETRMMLVPFVILFIPAALWVIQQSRREECAEARA